LFLEEFERVVALIGSNQQLGTPKQEGIDPGYWRDRHGDD
jgi:hypothetical protein